MRLTQRTCPTSHSGLGASRGLLAASALVLAAVLCGVAAEPARADSARLFLPTLGTGQQPAQRVTVVPARGLFYEPIVVTLASEPGAEIRYTADGSPPNAQSALYEGPLPIGTTTVLRAAAFKPGAPPSEVATATYIFPAQAVTQSSQPPGFPKFWGSVDGEPVESDYEMDPDVAQADERYRDRIAADLASLPSVSLVMPIESVFGDSGIYSNPLVEGRASERPVSVELIEPRGPGFQLDAGIRIAGGYSRHPHANAKHSFSLRFREEYGAAQLAYPLFPGSPVTEFDSLRLRAGQADTFEFAPRKAQYIHDEWGRRTHAAMGHLAASGRFVHVYLNGLYWGLYNLTEELDSDFAARHLGGKDDEYDVIEKTVNIPPEPEDGDMAAFERMMGVANLDTVQGYEEIQRHLDLVEYVDYTILELFGANRDWPENNWTAVRRRVPGARFQFLVWDIEQMTQLWRWDPIENRMDTAGAAGLHGRLIANPEYRVLFGDRAYKLLSAGGALEPSAATERYRDLAGDVEAAIVPESARWGDKIPGPLAYAQNRYEWDRYWRMTERGHPQTLHDEWIPERDRILGGFFADRANVFLGQLRERGLYPEVDAPILSLRSRVLRIASPVGTVYYTLDGTDPRLAGGYVAPSARIYKGPQVVGGYAHVKTRVLVGTVWSPMAEATYGTPSVSVSELMYHPADGGPEFVEIANLLPSGIDLSGASFVDGIEYTFPSGASLGGGAHIVLASDAMAFAERYPGVELAGVFARNLANEGERVRLVDSAGSVLADVTYADDGMWPVGPDGFGQSLVPIDPTQVEPWHPEHWRGSARLGGSPGTADPQAPPRTVVVSEVLAASSPPFEDAVELENLTAEPVDVSGWYLSDDRADADSVRKFRIPDGTVLEGFGRVVFYETQFGSGATGFGLSADGEGVYLAAAAGTDLAGEVTGVDYGPLRDGESFGRVITAGGAQLGRLSSRTFGVDAPVDQEDFRRGQGAPNAPPAVAPVVVAEIYPEPSSGGQEFIELENRSPSPVELFAPGLPNDAWMLGGAVTYQFPAGLTLAPGERIVIAGTDPERLRIEAGVPGDVRVIGPFEGRLKAAMDEVTLLAAVTLDGETVWRTEDRAFYRSVPPWPLRADGSRLSLERVQPTRFGPDPEAWIAVTTGGTPGRPQGGFWRILLPFGLRR